MGYTYEDALDKAVTELQQARNLLAAEIATYPTPIAGCDAHFNHLLSNRTRITNALIAIESHPFIATPRQLEPDEYRGSM